MQWLSLGRRPYLEALAALLALVPAWAPADDDFEELPLVPSLVETLEEEPETQPQEEDPVEEPDTEDGFGQADPEEEASPEPKGAREQGARRPERAEPSWSLMPAAGAYVPLSAAIPPGFEFSAVLARSFTRRLGARALLSWSSHRFEGPGLIEGRGMDEGFGEVANVMSLRMGGTWHLPGPLEPLYAHVDMGAALSLSERRVFSANSRSSSWQPAASLGLGFAHRLGLGRLRIETGLRAHLLSIGPEEAPLYRTRVGAGLVFAYAVEL